MAAEPARFAELFKKPSVDAMHALSPLEFEHFVAYVLQRAGFDSKVIGRRFLRGADVEVRRPGQTRVFAGIECKRYASSQLVNAHIVQHVKGASVVSRGDAKPFVITTSGFNDEAYQMANEGRKHAYLINGSQLVRYITYIQRSRYDDDDAISAISPEFFAGQKSSHTRTIDGAKILTIANNKGGVGKTMTAYYLGVELARQGKRVLMIDLDGQGNLTERCIPRQVAEHSEGDDHFSNIAHYFAGERPLQNLITPTETTKGMSLIPSDPFLTLRDLGGSGRPDVELRFVKDVQDLCMKPIASLGGTPDWIILDTPPAMSVFTRAGLAVAEYVISPIRLRPASLAGTRNMLRTMRTMNALMGTSAAFLGVAITHWDDLKLSRDFEEIEVPRLLRGTDGRAFAAKIPIDNQLEFLEPGANTGGAKAYEALAEELLRDIDQRSKIPVLATKED